MILSRSTGLIPTLLMVALLLGPARVGAQSGGQAAVQTEDPLARALTAYRNLEYDDAAARLRAALAPNAPAGLSEADRKRALMHLGATELFRDKRAAAIEAFRTLMLTDPRYRPDELIFPPEVSALFQETRFGVRAVAVLVPPEAEIRSTADRLPIRIYASSLHEVRARITSATGSPERTLHEGAIGDSLELLWNGRDGLGRLREPGRYLLRVTSRAPDGKDEREVEIGLDVERILIDTLPAPAPLMPSALRPETEVRATGIRPLVYGLLGAAMVVALPATIGGGDQGSSARFGVAGALGVAGIIGMTTSSRPRPIAMNIEWNRQQRDAWSREAERVRAENETRRAGTWLRIRAGRAVTVEIK